MTKKGENPTGKKIDGLVQDCSNSSALTMELLQSCAKSSMYTQDLQQIYF